MKNTNINGYTLKRFLGKGGMAEVWYAENSLGKPAAIKIMLPQFIGMEQVTSRFETEAKVMVQLSHPNIRQVQDIGIYENRPFIIMEFLEGKDMSQHLSDGRKFSDAVLEKWWEQCLSALAHTHEQGIIHRDIKPSNIFLQTNGDIKILDFGIAKVKDEISMTSTGQGLGTILYMSPEQIKDPKRVTPATDIYSLAATFATLIKGKSILGDTENESAYILQNKIVEGKLDLSGIPDKWQSLLRPFLDLDPDKRRRLSFVETPSNDVTMIDIRPKQSSPVKPRYQSQPKDEYRDWLSYLVIGLLLLALVLGFVRNGESNFDMAQSPVDRAVSEISASMVRISGGTFTMGCTSEQGSDCYTDESPAHEVTLRGYSLNKYQVTQSQWRSIMGSNPSSNSGCDRCPVEKVSWNEVQEFIVELNRVSGKRYRLPTEAEWEYAACGGQRSRGYIYSGSDNIGEVAWYRSNSGSKTHPVGQKKANELGLYDMSGNVWEWCSDRYGDYSASSQQNPSGTSSGSFPVNRGGSWLGSVRFCRVSYRNYFSSGFRYRGLGFRLATSD